MESLRDETYNLWIDYDYRTWKNVEDETLNFSNNVQLWKKCKRLWINFFCGETLWLRRIWLTVVLQAIRVLRNGEYAPYIVFIAAPTIATLQEVHRVSAPLYQCCLCRYIFSDPLGWAFSLIAILVLFWG